MHIPPLQGQGHLVADVRVRDDRVVLGRLDVLLGGLALGDVAGSELLTSDYPSSGQPSEGSEHRTAFF